MTSLIGDWSPERMVIIEFPDRERIERWFSSPEYRVLAPLRERSTKGRAIVVDGYR